MAQPARPGFVPYEQVEHTADLAYIARGRTLEELFRHAALGLLSFMVDPAEVRPARTLSLAAEGSDPEECLVSWLQEILYHVEVRRFLFRDFRVDSCILRDGTERVRGSGTGEELDPDRHRILTDLKAVTYHDLMIRRIPSAAGPLYAVRIVVDV